MATVEVAIALKNSARIIWLIELKHNLEKAVGMFLNRLSIPRVFLILNITQILHGRYRISFFHYPPTV